MKPDWWEGLAPIETAGPAGAKEHRLAWRDGELHLLAHADPDAETALAALGGDVCPCLDLLDTWRDNHRTGSILVLGARQVGEVLSAPEAALDAIAADLAHWRGALASLRTDARAAGDGDVLDRLASLRSPEEAAAQRRLGGLLLLTLDRRLQHRLQASVAAALASGRDLAEISATSRPERVPAVLRAATAARARPALQRLGWSAGIADIHIGDTPELTTTRAVLPTTWVAAVWGRNLASAVADHLVLDVTSVTPDGAVTVVAAAPGKAQVVFRVDQWENA